MHKCMYRTPRNQDPQDGVSDRGRTTRLCLLLGSGAASEIDSVLGHKGDIESIVAAPSLPYCEIKVCEGEIEVLMMGST